MRHDTCRLLPSRFARISSSTLTISAFSTFIALTTVAPASGQLLRGAPLPTPAQKIDGALASALTVADRPVEMLVYVGAPLDLSPASLLRGKQAKGRYVHAALTQAARAQEPLLASLAARRVPHRSLWIAQAVWVEGTARLAAELAARPEVRRIEANPTLRLSLPDAVSQAEANAIHAAEGGCPLGGDMPEWGVERIGSPAVWDLGFTGQGVVIGGQDTGYRWDHPALRDQYRGWNGSSADHDYNWHDAIHSGGGSCGANSSFPCDDHGHGTHTMGTMVGDNGAGNKIGVAPGAKWIGCRNMNVGDGTPATYLECFQWFMAPTPVAGGAGDPDRAPDVINNSWGCTPGEGCIGGPEIEALRQAVVALRTAGILVVVSAGNSGPTCGSVDSPAAIYDESFTVGATTSTDLIASFSSRGPVDVFSLDLLKPDVSAPGVAICSSTRSGNYGLMQGTSMAGPHVAGLVALILAQRPCLRGEVDLLESLIRRRATPLFVNQTCGGVNSLNESPNNTFGYGLVQAGLEPCFAVCDDFELGGLDAWCPNGDPLLRGR